MAEGGHLPWKIQTIFTRGPVADYRILRKPLPNPPAGQVWYQNQETKEWKLVPEKLVVVEPDESSSSSHTNSSSIVAVVRNTEDHDDDDDDDDWEEVMGVGSVRSLSSHTSHSHSNISNKIQRTHSSSSTIDSSDVDGGKIIGPSGKGILGVDYVEHVVLPNDTMQGICIAYKIHPTALRKANHFSGCSLMLAPKKLVIPVSKKALRGGFLRVQDTASKEYKVHAIQAEVTDLSTTEATAYVRSDDTT